MVQYSCSIIANPEGKSWNFAQEVDRTLRTRDKSFELIRVYIKRFRDGEIKTKVEDNVRGRKCFFIHDSSEAPADWFYQLALVNYTLRNSSASEITDVLPYLKFSRQDKKDESRVPISARVLADVIGRYTNRVLTLDVHNFSIQGFYDIPFDNLSSFPVVVKQMSERHPEFLEDLVIMSPDSGGARRAEAFAKKMNVSDIVVGYKTRPEAGEVEKVRILGEVEDRNVLIVDDILDSGNTLVKTRAALREAGAKKVYAYCTHALFTEGVQKLTACFDLVIVGDTISNASLEKEPKLEQISFAPLFAESIRRIHHGQSLSELFERQEK